MPNGSTITLPAPLMAGEFRLLLREAVRSWFGSKVKIETRLFLPGRHPPTYLVRASSPVVDPKRAQEACVALGDPFGFTIELQEGTVIYSPSSPNRWERWAQGCVLEALSELVDRPVVCDATDEANAPGTRYYRQAATFQQFMSLTGADPQRFRAHVPPGFWDGA